MIQSEMLTMPVLISVLIALGASGACSRICTYSLPVCFTWKSECEEDYKTLEVICRVMDIQLG